MPETEFLTVLSVGFLIGLRHALDADHLAAVSAVLAERPSLRASSAVGLWWGIGHTLMLLLVGGILLASGFRLPDAFETVAESAVGILLMILGGSLALKLYRERWHVHSHRHGAERHLHLHSHQLHPHHQHRHWLAPSLRPFCVGMVHGLAGSAAVMLMLVSTTGQLAEGLVTIAVFGLGSIVGMMGVGLTFTVPLICTAAVSRRVFVVLQGLASVASLGLGAWMIVKFAWAATGP